MGLLLALYGGFRFWAHATVPADAPRIAFSLDDTWLNHLGVTRATYDRTFGRAGGRLVPLEPTAAGDPVVDPEKVKALLAGADALLLSGGGDVDPALSGAAPDHTILVKRLRDEFEIALIREARARRIPILGICRGCQILNVALGGTLRSLRDDDRLRSKHFAITGHGLTVAPESRVAKILETYQIDRVTSFHGQAVDAPAPDVRAVAWADAEKTEIEAIELAGDAWALGVQWHPEMEIGDERHFALILDFVNEARKARARRLAARPNPAR